MSEASDRPCAVEGVAERVGVPLVAGRSGCGHRAVGPRPCTLSGQTAQPG